jgi:hypothetical protein
MTIKNISVEWFFQKIANNWLTAALEIRVYRQIVSRDPKLQSQADADLSNPEYMQKCTELRNRLLEAVRKNDLDALARAAGAISAESAGVPHP